MRHLLCAFFACQRGVGRVGGGRGRSSSCSSFSIKAAPPPQLLLRAVINQRLAKQARNAASLHSNFQDDQEDTFALEDELRDVQYKIILRERDIEEIDVTVYSKYKERCGVDVKTDEAYRETRRVQVEQDQVNVEIKECEAALKSDSISETERSILLQKEQSLRVKEQSLLDKEARLGVEKQSLIDEKARLLLEGMSLRDEGKRLRAEKQSLRDMELLLIGELVDQERLTGIDLGVKEETLKHSFDRNQFVKEVQQLFTWFDYEEVRKEFKAPYLPLVQSSGMGKTKLLYETNKFFNSDTQVKSFLILCLSGSDQDTKPPDIYSHILHVGGIVTASTKSSIIMQLDNVVKNVTTGKVVLFLDEAQHLLRNDAFGFLCVRWWLRRNDRASIQVTGVLAGTSSGLANYIKDEYEPTQYSRDPVPPYYKSGNKGFDPFFRLFTIGLFVKQHSSVTARTTDYDIAVPYGRPLFAVMHNKGQLNHTKEMAIFRRMTLSKFKWYNNDLACLSVLGTRVQMGQASLSVASYMVKHGYACLTNFSESAKVAQIAFMPDPVCARLAMCAMDPDWQSYNKKGLKKDEWSRKMAGIVSRGLCHPHKGNLGEVASALYLLFCGDLLRARIDPSYRCFQVPLQSFLSVAFNPNQDLPNQTLSSSTAVPESPHVSFIQVCRNHARTSAKDRFSSMSLEWMYNAACASYCYDLCPAIDWYAPIRVVDTAGKVAFVPLVVSVKTQCKFTPGKVKEEFLSMQEELKEGEHSSGVCMLFLIGLDNTSEYESGIYDVTNKKCKRSPEQKCDLLSKGILNVLVCVEADNSFGLSDVVTQTTMNGDAYSEIFASHGLFRGLPMNSTILRQGANNEEQEFMNNLSEAFLSIS